MGGDPNKQLMLLRCEMERIRSKLHKALDAAGGKHLDESVQEISRQFDRVFSTYMQLMAARRKGEPSPSGDPET